MKIKWMGPFNHSGFGVENIGMVKALLRLGHDVQCVIAAPGGVVIEGIKDIQDCFEPRPEGWADRTVVHSMPPPIDEEIDVLWLNYEFSPAPDSWRYTVNHARVLAVESDHARDCIKSIIRPARDIKIVPSGIDVNFGQGGNPQRVVEKDEFAFLSCFEWVPRKQGELLIRAFCEEFAADEKVYLFIKASRGTDNPRAAIPRIVHEYPNMVGRVVYIDQHFDDMGKVYPCFDGYVLPSALEGWGITFMEAIACGIKPVCPGVGGNMMFCTTDNSYQVEMNGWEHATLFGDWTLFSPAAQWRVPDKTCLKAQMRNAYTEKARLSPEYTKAFREKWSWENAAKKLLEAMQ